MTNLTLPALNDGVVVLRSWEMDDADEQVAAFADPLFVQFSDWAPTTREEVLKRLTVIDREREQGTGMHLAIADADYPKTALGEVSLNMKFKNGRRDTLVFGLLPPEFALCEPPKARQNDR